MLPKKFYFDSILDRLKRAAQWRQTVAQKHSDSRNLTAASELARFSKGRFSDVLPGTWTALSSHLGADHFLDAIDVAVRNVGFRSRPADINEFLLSIANAALPMGGSK